MLINFLVRTQVDAFVSINSFLKQISRTYLRNKFLTKFQKSVYFKDHLKVWASLIILGFILAKWRQLDLSLNLTCYITLRVI